MNIGLNLKIKKNVQEMGHRRTRTDYANTKTLIDSFMKQNIPQSSTRATKCIYLGIQNKDKNYYQNQKNIYNKPKNLVATQYYQKPINKKSQTFRPKVDLLLKKSIKNQIDVKQNIYSKPTQSTIKTIDRYEWERKVGAGTFGTVHKARDRKTLQIVAIKKVFQDPKYKNRQLQILKMLKHPNVLQMKQYFITYQSDKQYLNIVMDYYPTNLYDYIQQYKGKKLSRLKYKLIAYQLFRGLLYLRQKNIAHRDIKPHNILLRDSDLKTLICDFGSAKILVPQDQNISYICSRCYRAPQLIFDNTSYTTQIDVWSMGCVLIQMVTGVPTFRANSNSEQLIEIIKVLGTPSLQDIIKMNPKCDINNFTMPKLPKKDWSKILKINSLGQQFVDLLNGIMKYSPSQRLNPLQILQHPFFDQLRMESIYNHLKKQLKIQPLFNFSKQFKSNKFNTLIPDWYLSFSQHHN